MAAATPITVPVEAEREINAQRGEVVSIADAIVIADQASYERAASHLTAVKALQVKVGEMFDDLVSAAHKAHKLLTERRAQHTNPLLAAERALKSKMSAYVTEQERIARQRAAEAAAKAREEEEARRLAEAAELEKAGESEAALAVLDEPVNLPPPAPLGMATPRADGISTRETWHAEVTDLMALVKAIAAGQAPLSLVEASKNVGGWARSTHGTVQIPGVRVWSTKEIAARAR
jgi:hypothetical protein